jgi:hypothetical protein
LSGTSHPVSFDRAGTKETDVWRKVVVEAVDPGLVLVERLLGDALSGRGSPANSIMTRRPVFG